MADPTLLAVAGGGLIGGLVLLVRGMAGFGTGTRLEDTAVSRIGSLAVGEVLVSGTVETDEVTLVSPLQSATCVFYRARIDEPGGDGVPDLREERAVGFSVRDASGEIRIFPRGARFDVPDRFRESTGAFGETPPGVRLRAGSAYGRGSLLAEDREAQIAALLTVRPARGGAGAGGDMGAAGGAGSSGWPGFAIGRLTDSSAGRSRSRRYAEARIEPGDVVTVLGRALPFDQLSDPASADHLDAADPLLDDAGIARDLATAREAGHLHDNPEDAWGNAAIPGFGIGRPVREPELDEGVAEPPIAAPAEAARFERTFRIAPDALVLAAAPDLPLVVSVGPPATAARRHQGRFLVGLLGAVVSIGSAMILAALLSGSLAS